MWRWQSAEFVARFVEVPRLRAEGLIVIYPSDSKNEQNCFTSRDTHQLIQTISLADIISLFSWHSLSLSMLWYMIWHMTYMHNIFYWIWAIESDILHWHSIYCHYCMHTIIYIKRYDTHIMLDKHIDITGSSIYIYIWMYINIQSSKMICVIYDITINV